MVICCGQCLVTRQQQKARYFCKIFQHATFREDYNLLRVAMSSVDTERLSRNTGRNVPIRTTFDSLYLDNLLHIKIFSKKHIFINHEKTVQCVTLAMEYLKIACVNKKYGKKNLRKKIAYFYNIFAQHLGKFYVSYKTVAADKVSRNAPYNIKVGEKK
jgi:hypothetical protein